MTQILLTRPIEDSLKTAEVLIDNGYHVVISPLMDVVYIPFTQPQKCDGYVFTSRYALKALEKSEAEINKSLPVFVNGIQTAISAGDFGFENIHVSKSQSYGIPSLIKNINPNGHHAYISAEDISQEIDNAERIIAYKAVLNPSLSDHACEFLENISPSSKKSYALFYSARTATHFANLVHGQGYENSVKQSLECMCISERVALVLKNQEFQRVRFANEPSEQGLFSMLQT